MIKGYPDGTFKPYNEVKVDEFITMILRACNYNLENGDEYWASNYIIKAKELGFVIGGEFNTYKRAITRGEMARIIDRALKNIEGNVTYKNDPTTMSQYIKDYNTISEALTVEISHVYALGILTGMPMVLLRLTGFLTGVPSTFGKSQL